MAPCIGHPGDEPIVQPTKPCAAPISLAHTVPRSSALNQRKGHKAQRRRGMPAQKDTGAAWFAAPAFASSQLEKVYGVGPTGCVTGSAAEIVRASPPQSGWPQPLGLFGWPSASRTMS